MPKPMMMRVAVEEIAFGRVFRLLKNMSGVVSLDIDGEPDKKPNGSKAPRGKTKEGTSAICIVLQRLVADKTVQPTVLMDTLQAAGYSRKTWGNIVAKFRDDKLATKTAKGWKATKAGATFCATNCKGDK